MGYLRLEADYSGANQKAVEELDKDNNKHSVSPPGTAWLCNECGVNLCHNPDYEARELLALFDTEFEALHDTLLHAQRRPEKRRDAVVDAQFAEDLALVAKRLDWLCLQHSLLNTCTPMSNHAILCADKAYRKLGLPSPKAINLQDPPVRMATATPRTTKSVSP